MRPPSLNDPLLLLLAGLAIDAMFGDMRTVFRFVPHPVVLAGRAIASFERKLNRPQRTERARRERGIMTVVALVGAAAAIGWVIQALCRGRPLGALIEALLIGILVAARSLFLHVAAVALALRDSGLQAGRKAVSHIVGRDPER
ncbi:MAG TPA: cobalamin biosynthesis protein, partial [Stellaceae bacterium]|nr:cobalamin biosynthesis protein [Stellaceae bacterium]